MPVKYTGETPAIRKRQRIEMRIASAIIDSALAQGYALGVFDGEEHTVTNSTDRGKIREALMTTDEDYLCIYREGKKIGSVYLVYGNDGWDVICDYTTALDDLGIMAEANALADRLAPL
jgi:hypothetical protein